MMSLADFGIGATVDQSLAMMREGT